MLAPFEFEENKFYQNYLLTEKEEEGEEIVKKETFNKENNFNNEFKILSKDDFDFYLKGTQFASSFIFSNNEIFKNENEENESLYFLQKKRNFSNSQELLKKSGKHDKYANDNIEKKIKNKILKVFKDFINEKISKVFTNKKLLNIAPNQNIFKAEENKKILNKKFKDIFSVNINRKYEHYDKNHNKQLIQDLLVQKDEEKKTEFKKLFNLTFLDALQHFRGSNSIQELNGMTTIKEDIKTFKKKYSEKYKQFFREKVDDYENIIMNKKERKKKTQKKTNLSPLLSNIKK